VIEFFCHLQNLNKVLACVYFIEVLLETMNGNDIVAYANSTRCCKISMNASSGFSECAGWAMWGGGILNPRALRGPTFLVYALSKIYEPLFMIIFLL